jgi:putative ABC transport system substrate-binding protein
MEFPPAQGVNHVTPRRRNVIVSRSASRPHLGGKMRRRDFITLVGSAAGAWPLAARAQVERVRRIGILMGWSEGDPEYRVRVDAVVQGLAQLGWVEGRNVRFDVRWTNGDVGRAQALAKELVALQPDVIVAGSTPATAALQRETRMIPIVFAAVADPVGAGFGASLARPGGNVTGFVNSEASLTGKQVELLKEIAPRLTRVAIMFNPDTAPGGGGYYLGLFEAAAKSLAVEPITARVRSDSDIEGAVASIGRERGGIVGMNDSFISIHRRTLILSAVRESVPTIADVGGFSREGGLITYGPNNVDLFRRAVPYVDRILRGTNPGDLPVQLPTQFDLTINLKTAKALGLDVPNSLLVGANEVIE